MKVQGVQRRDLLFISLGWILFTVAMWLSSDSIFSYLDVFYTPHPKDKIIPCDDSVKHYFEHYSYQPHDYNHSSSHHRHHSDNSSPYGTDSNSEHFDHYSKHPNSHQRRKDHKYKEHKDKEHKYKDHHKDKEHNGHKYNENESSDSPSHSSHHSGKHSKGNFGRFSHHQDSNSSQFTSKRGITVVWNQTADIIGADQFTLILSLQEYIYIKGNARVEIYASPRETIKDGINLLTSANCVLDEVDTSSCEKPAQLALGAFGASESPTSWMYFVMPATMSVPAGDYKLLYVITTQRWTFYNGYNLQVASNGTLSLREGSCFTRHNIDLISPLGRNPLFYDC